MVHYAMEMNQANKVRLYNIEVFDGSKEEALKNILDFTKTKNKGFVVTPNVDHIVKLSKDKEFLDTYQKASMVLIDSMQLFMVSRILGRKIKEKISGSDFFFDLLSLAEEQKLSIFFLGTSESSLLKAEEKLKKDYPHIKLKGKYSPPFGFENNMSENDKIEKMINEARPDFLFLFLGAPKQEKWIYHHLNNINIKLAFCLGATLDFYSGNIKRAPLWMQKIGLEWVWRMVIDPKRLIKRYLIDDMFPFIWLTAKEFWRIRIQKK
jgi:N-acetylglucosaminyldiphosphoundecaprenol N-acetyl-beta-D-mannosaminyltransferase